MAFGYEEELRAEIARLREAIRSLSDQDATLSVVGGNVIVEMDATPEILEQLSQRGGPLMSFDPPKPTLTDAEREAIQWAAGQARLFPEFDPICGHADALRGLLERLELSNRTREINSREQRRRHT